VGIQLLSDRTETWDNQPVHIYEIGLGFERPVVVAHVRPHGIDPKTLHTRGKRKIVVPALDFSLEDEWEQPFRDHVRASVEAVHRDGYGVHFTADDYVNACTVTAILIRTPKAIHCTAFVFPIPLTLDDILLLVPASLVTKPATIRDETWGTLPVHYAELDLPVESGTWLALSDDVDAETSRILFLDESDSILQGFTRSKRTILGQVETTPLKDTMGNQVRSGMRTLQTVFSGLPQDDLALFPDPRGLALILRWPTGYSYVAAIASNHVTTENVLLFVPVQNVLASVE